MARCAHVQVLGAIEDVKNNLFVSVLLIFDANRRDPLAKVWINIIFCITTYSVSRVINDVSVET